MRRLYVAFGVLAVLVFSGCLEGSRAAEAALDPTNARGTEAGLPGLPGESSPSDVTDVGYSGATGVQVCVPVPASTFCVYPVYEGNRNDHYDLDAKIHSIDLTVSWQPASAFTEEMMLRIVHNPGPSTDEAVVLGTAIGSSPLRLALGPDDIGALGTDIRIDVDPKQHVPDVKLRATPVSQDFAVAGSFVPATPEAG